jgi:DNA repair photolyase
MIVNEVQTKSILSKSQVFPYTINAYTGCEHACSYCYARFMRRFSGHKEPWGEFVDVKVNAPQLLAKQIAHKTPARVWISGVCDPYQPLEAQYRLTRQCLEILIAAHWPVLVQTKSPLVARDIDILRTGEGVEVGLSIATADEHIRQLFEPHAPSIPSRIEALQALHDAGIQTFVMIAPILPGAEELPEMLTGNADAVLVDRMNYNYADWVYRKYGLERYCTEEFFDTVSALLKSQLHTSTDVEIFG